MKRSFSFFRVALSLVIIFSVITLLQSRRYASLTCTYSVSEDLSLKISVIYVRSLNSTCDGLARYQALSVGDSRYLVNFFIHQSGDEQFVTTQVLQKESWWEYCTMSFLMREKNYRIRLTITDDPDYRCYVGTIKWLDLGNAFYLNSESMKVLIQPTN